MFPTSRARMALLVAAIIILPVLVTTALRAQAASPAVERMHAHLTALTNIDYAVVRGDLDDVREMSKALLNELSMDGLPTNAQKYLGDLKGAAREAGEATTIEAAARAVGMMSAACGACHAGLGTPIAMTAPARPPSISSVRARMLEHYYSVDMMGLGLQSPSDDHWKRGADTMRKAQVMKVTMKDEALARDLNEAETAYKQIGVKASGARTPAERAAVYGEVLTSCGNCHSLHGRVFGPGLPKL